MTKAKDAALTRLQFKSANHQYVLDGMVIPSVTQVLDLLSPFDHVPPQMLEEARLRGTLVHKLTEVADRGEPWQDDADETALSGYIEAWEAFKRENSVVILASEQRVYHTKYRYAGTFDRVVTLGTSLVPVVLDIKSGDLHNEYALQTAAYAYAFNEGRTKAEHILDRVAVALQPNGKWKMDYYPHKNMLSDFQVFLAALTITTWRMQNG